MTGIVAFNVLAAALLWALICFAALVAREAYRETKEEAN